MNDELVPSEADEIVARDERIRRNVAHAEKRKAIVSHVVERLPSFTNLKKDPTLIEAGSSIVSVEQFFQEFEDLIALAELYNFEDTVFAFDKHGIVPVMYIDRSQDEIKDTDTRIVKKIYCMKSTEDGTPHSTMWGDGWDPSVLHPEMEVVQSGTEYLIQV